MSGDGTIFELKDKRTGKVRKYVLEISRGKDPVTGKRVRDRTYYDTKAEAKRARAALLNRLYSGTYIAPHRITVGEYLEGQWLPSMKSSLRENTWHEYAEVVRRRIVPNIGGVRLQQLTAMDLNAFYAHLLKNGRIRRVGKSQSPGLSPTTVRQTHAIIRRALQDALEGDLVVKNVAIAARPPKAKASAVHKPQVLTLEQLHAFLDVAREDRLYALWLLAATTGARRGELLAVDWADVDLKAGTLAITETLVMADGKAVRQAPKTANSRRSISLDPATVAALRKHRSRQRKERLAAGAAYDASTDAVFRREDGRELHPDSLLKKFRALLKKAGLPAVRVHDLRHGFATLALEGNIHPLVVSKRLGHANPTQVMSTYSHVTPRLDREAADAVGGLIAGGGGYKLATDRTGAET